MILKKINEAANNWNKTKDPKYKEIWYKLVKEYGLNNIKRRIVSTDSSDKRNNGRNRHNS
jgi:hypothetical protein